MKVNLYKSNFKYKLCQLFLSLTIINSVQLSGIDLLTKTVQQNDLQSIPCIKKFCVKYFRSDHALKGSLVIMNLTPKPQIIQNKIIQAINDDPHHEFSVMVKNAQLKHLNASHVSEKAQNYFMFIASNKDVNQTLRQWKSLPTWNPLAQVVILFTKTFDNHTLNKQIRNVLEELLENGMLNVNIISHRIDTNYVQSMTWFPYENENCAKEILKIRLIDECEYNNVESQVNDLRTTSYYYENDTGDNVNQKRRNKIPKSLHGCPLTISSSIWEPYTFYEPNHGFTKGIEVLMLQTITNVLNIRPIYYLLNETRENRRNADLNRGYLNLIDG